MGDHLKIFQHWFRWWLGENIILNLNHMSQLLVHIDMNRRSIEMSTWWRHQMETFSVSLAICAGNSPVNGEFPSQRPVTRNFDVVFDLRPNKLLSKQYWGWWFETPSRQLWRHRNENKHVCSMLPIIIHYNSCSSWEWPRLEIINCMENCIITSFV